MRKERANVIGSRFYQDPVSQKTTTWYVVNEHDKVLMNKICKYGKIHWNISPLCNNWDLYKKLKVISMNKWVEFWLLVGITYAESHIWANHSSDICATYNNRSGIKWKKLDNWTVLKNELPDENGCRLYKFDSVEDYRNSFTNSIKLWYIDKDCKTPECISQYRVRADWKVKDRWSYRVNLFRNN